MERLRMHWDPRQVGPVSESYAPYASIPRLTLEAFLQSGRFC